jgi:hypothetical protein
LVISTPLKWPTITVAVAATARTGSARFSELRQTGEALPRRTCQAEIEMTTSVTVIAAASSVWAKA